MATAAREKPGRASGGAGQAPGDRLSPKPRSDGDSRLDCVIVLGAAFRDRRQGPTPALLRGARHGARLALAKPGRVPISVGGGPAREAAACGLYLGRLRRLRTAVRRRRRRGRSG